MDLDLGVISTWTIFEAERPAEVTQGRVEDKANEPWGPRGILVSQPCFAFKSASLKCSLVWTFPGNPGESTGASREIHCYFY